MIILLPLLIAWAITVNTKTARIRFEWINQTATISYDDIENGKYSYPEYFKYLDEINYFETFCEIFFLRPITKPQHLK